MTKSNQQSVDKMAEYKERYRGLRAAMGDKDKQLDLAKRTIERLSGQCNAMEASNLTTCVPQQTGLSYCRCCRFAVQVGKARTKLSVLHTVQPDVLY